MKSIKLINGPYDGRVIDDSGSVLICMALSTDGETPGAKIGSAIYGPSGDRACAFWEGNEWLGTLVEVIIP